MEKNTKYMYWCLTCNIKKLEVSSNMRIYMVNITCINSIYGIKEGFKLNWQCSSRKYPYSPHRKDWKFLGGGGFSKAPKFT